MSALDDFRQFVQDAQAGAQYTRWARDNPGDLGRWQVFRDQVTSGLSPAAPTMTSDHGRELVDAAVQTEHFRALEQSSAPTVPSADNTVVKDTTGQIVSGNGHVWRITAAGKVSVDGTADPITSAVVELAYESGKVWQRNSAGLWWYKIAPTDSWLPTIGTAVSPVPGDNPPPPTPTGTRHWGISPSNNGGWTAPIDQQLATYKALGVKCPRIPSGASDAALAAGFTEWKAWVTGDGSATIDQLVAYAKAYPQAIMVSFGNELNLNGWTAAAVAAKQIAAYNAFRNAGLDPNRLGLSSIGNSKSSAEGLLPIDWARHLRSAGCVYGKGLGANDVHMYHLDPQTYDNWMHVVTPDAAGESIQSILGHPPFYVTEMGCKIGWVFGSVTVDENHQAQSAAAWVAWCANAADCHGADWFQLNDGSQWPGYGLIDGSGRKRPSYVAYQTAISTHAAPLAIEPADHDAYEFSAAKIAQPE